MSLMKFDVPVFMYHSVGVPSLKWKWHYLTCPYEKFELQLIAIKEMGLKTISLEELYDYMVNGKPLKQKSVVLTFDDGYADIWVYAYPLLKKYNMCGTVYINPDFVEDRKENRLRLDQKVDDEKLKDEGFLSWNEIKQMDEEGVVFSESHALTHTWYPTSTKIIDFRHPKDDYLWMTWNKYPLKKPHLQIDNPNLIEYGAPVFQNEKSLLAKKCEISNDLSDYLVNFVKNNNGIKFFDKANWKEILQEETDLFLSTNDIKFRNETDAEYKERVSYELKISKEILEAKLGRKIEFLCWPGGSASNIGMSIAQDIGYKLFNSARDMKTEERRNVENIAFGGIRMKRFSPVCYFNGQENEKSKIIYANKLWTKMMILRHQNKYLSKYWYKISKIIVDFYCNNISSKSI